MSCHLFWTHTKYRLKTNKNIVKRFSPMNTFQVRLCEELERDIEGETAAEYTS